MATKLELQSQLNEVTIRLAAANQEISFLRQALNNADIRTKRVIASVNRSARFGTSERRAAMEAARAQALATGKLTKVGGDHV